MASSALQAASVSDPAAELWATVLARLPRGHDRTFSATLAAVQPVGLDHGVLRLSVPSAFHRERLSSRYLDGINEAVGNLLPGTRVQIVVEQEAPAHGPDQLRLELDERGDSKASRSEKTLNPRFRFETFVVGESNRLPHAAALSLAENTETEYNPLFIYGEPGNGKTHLLHAIAHYVQAHSPHLEIRYVTSEQFTGEFIEGVKRKQLDGFKRRYRSCSVLLVDDIQFLEGKEATLIQFFHTFNEVIAAGGRVVLAADRHPREIALPERLRSRFISGLVANLDAPGPETRVAILRRKSESKGVEVPEDVLAMVASEVTRNVRELEGALNRVVADASLDKRPVTVDGARRSVEAFLGSSGQALTLDHIIEKAAEVFGFSVEDLRGHSRRRPLVAARQAAMYVCRALTEESLPAIGRSFGGRDHTTVLYSVRKVEEQMTKRTAVYDKVVELMNRLGSLRSRLPGDGRI
ncbi:MAG: chromosomal replication initiator protein DnaA [Actinomycetota bacterium]|nr:chromosomal replication initiator protein DnaA [Actinomycetota bacterium]